MTPYLAARRFQTVMGGPLPAHVERPRSAVTHIGVTVSRRHPPTPLCGQRGKRWRQTSKWTTRRLCGRCDAFIAKWTADVPLTLNAFEVVYELRGAIDKAQVIALRSRVIAVGPLAPYEGHPLHSHYVEALERVST